MSSYNHRYMYRPSQEASKILTGLIGIILIGLVYWSNYTVINWLAGYTLEFFKQTLKGLL